jgi:NADPH-dependent glutamate synthase beta chain and related oxidoreductases
VGGPFASIQIDMMDKLPTPFGLVRSGVAPDHPEVKNVMHDFCKLFQQQEQQQQQQQQQAQHQIQQPSPQVEFWGNVHVGKDVSLKELQSLYHVVVLAYGCESDQRLGIEGEDVLHGIFSAREFVAWYNGHPEFVSLGNQVGQLIKGNHGKEGVAGEGGEGMNVVVIGQGNVALDCARVLVKGQKGLVETDIASDALNVIGNGVRRTTVLGRRGHTQGAFTIKELRELTKLDHVDFVVKEKELNEGATLSSLEELKGGGARPKVRIDKLLRDVARLRKKKQEDAKEQKEGHQKEVILRFLLNPIKFLPGVVDGTRVGSVLCERTRLEGQPGRQVAVGTGVMEEIPADMVLVSIGYKGVKLPGMDKSLFDDRRGIVRNTHGKVIDNLYVSGWLKRGPSGIIGTNIMDAKDTVSSILKDLEEETSTGSDKMVKGRKGLGELLLERGVRYVDWPSYQRIDAAEMDPLRLRTKNQPREKITSVEEMLTYVK